VDYLSAPEMKSAGVITRAPMPLKKAGGPFAPGIGLIRATPGRRPLRSPPRVSKQNGLSAGHLRPLETARRALGIMSTGRWLGFRRDRIAEC
jgi:hypothetical protein